jgi:hypothetical protein
MSEWDDDERFWCHPLERRSTPGALPAPWQARTPEHA